jgi:hypothetical protein
LDSDVDKDYISSMLEFKEMLTGLNQLNMGNEVDLAKYEGMEGDDKTEFADSEMGSDFTIQWGEGFAE